MVNSNAKAKFLRQLEITMPEIQEFIDQVENVKKNRLLVIQKLRVREVLCKHFINTAKECMINFA